MSNGHQNGNETGMAVQPGLIEELGSEYEGSKMFANIISSQNVNEFMDKIFEKQPLHIKRNKSTFYDFLEVSTEAIDEMLRSNVVEFTKNLDITSYTNGQRETHNPDGRAMPASVWEFYKDGCSVRLLNPQTFMPRLFRLNALLQEYFHCLVGANIYLTPPNSQGFAPHYDDIDAFVLQIEGKKHWRLYKPRNENESYPRESSGNFKENEIGEVALEITLEAGDLLYFPRGWIHQANTVPGHHSLHITLSTGQKTAYADLFEEMMKDTLKTAFENDVSYRFGLPSDIWYNFGAAHSDIDSLRRDQIKEHMKELFSRLIDHMDLDKAVDRMATKFQHDALPPYLKDEEKKRTTYGTKAIVKSNGKIKVPELLGNTQVRLIRANIMRLTDFEGVPQLYYYSDNSKEYHQYEMNYIELDDVAVDVAKVLIKTYPSYIKIRDLANDFDEAMTMARELWGRGLLMSKTPLL